jgi:hypothetical protein
MQPYGSDRCAEVQSGSHDNAGSKADQNQGYHDQPPAVRSPFKFLHADRREVRIFGMGGRCPSALYGRCVLYRQREHSTRIWASRIEEFPVGHLTRNLSGAQQSRCSIVLSLTAKQGKRRGETENARCSLPA